MKCLSCFILTVLISVIMIYTANQMYSYVPQFRADSLKGKVIIESVMMVRYSLTVFIFSPAYITYRTLFLGFVAADILTLFFSSIPAAGIDFPLCFIPVQLFLVLGYLVYGKWLAAAVAEGSKEKLFKVNTIKKNRLTVESAMLQ